MIVRRFAHGCLLGALLLPAGGCLSASNFRGDDFAKSIGLHSESAPDGAPAARDLPGTEAARVCLKVAAEMEQNGYDKEALVQYEAARRHDPRIPILSRKLAVLYDRIGDEPKALEEYNKALAAQPKDVDLLNSYGYFHYSRRRFPEAEEQFRKALVLNDKHAKSWTHLGMTLGQMGRYQDSLDAFGKAVKPAEAQANLAFILTTQGRREEAKAAYRQALAMEPNLAIARMALEKLENPQTSNDGRGTTPLSTGARAQSRPERPGSPAAFPTPPPPPGSNVVPGPGERRGNASAG